MIWGYPYFGKPPYTSIPWAFHKHLPHPQNIQRIRLYSITHSLSKNRLSIIKPIILGIQTTSNQQSFTIIHFHIFLQSLRVVWVLPPRMFATSTWLVVDLPTWKIWKSIGMMKIPIYGKIKVMFQTTNQQHKITSTPMDPHGVSPTWAPVGCKKNRTT